MLQGRNYEMILVRSCQRWFASVIEFIKVGKADLRSWESVDASRRLWLGSRFLVDRAEGSIPENSHSGSERGRTTSVLKKDTIWCPGFLLLQ